MTPSNHDPTTQPSAAGPTISVVIPVHNGADTIARAVRSALEQTVAPQGVIVVDDASTDETSAAVRGLADSRVTLATGPGEGPASARNIGIKRASGEWIAFLDADDYWEADFLAFADTRIQAAPGAVACFGAATHIDDRGRVVARALMRGRVTLADLASGRVVPTMSAALVRRDAALACGGFFEQFTHGGEDIDLWLRLAATGTCVGFTDARSVYVVHDERDRARSLDALTKMERDRELVVERFALSGAPARLVRRARAVTRARTARYWLRAEQRRHARAAAISSLRALPTLEGAATLLLAALPAGVRRPLVAARRVGRARGLPLGR